MDADAIRILEVPQEDIQQTRVSNFVRVFGEIAQQPQNAKEMRGKCVIGLSNYDDDPRPNWVIPEIRRFIQALDRDIPYFPYFLFGDPATEHLLFYLLCLVPISAGENGPGYIPMDLISAAIERSEHVARFCETIDDEVERAINPILLNLPVDVVKDIPDLATKVLEAMGPTLRALELNADPKLSAPRGQVLVNSILLRAAALSSIDPSQYSSQELLIRELSGRANNITSQEVARFDDAFDACSERVGNGKLQVSMVKLRQVVKEQRRAAYYFVESHLMLAAAQPGYLQPAYMVAALLKVEFNDSAPMRRVEERGKELDAPPELWMPQALS